MRLAFEVILSLMFGLSLLWNMYNAILIQNLLKEINFKKMKHCEHDDR